MNIERKEDGFYEIKEIHPKEFNLTRSALSNFVKLCELTELDFVDEQEKVIRTKELTDILVELSKENGSQTAESWDEEIFCKVISKYVKC